MQALVLGRVFEPRCLQQHQLLPVRRRAGGPRLQPRGVGPWVVQVRAAVRRHRGGPWVLQGWLPRGWKQPLDAALLIC